MNVGNIKANWLVLRHLEEMKSPRSQKRNEVNSLVKDLIKTEQRKSSEPANIKKEPINVQRNMPLTGHSSMPKAGMHKRARSDYEAIKSRGLPKAIGDKDELSMEHNLSPERDEAIHKSRLNSRRPSNTGSAALQADEEKIEKSDKFNEIIPVKPVPAGQQGAEEGHNTSSARLQDTILHDREKLIRYNVQYLSRHKEISPTSIDYYKFVKLIGKGAFGKVTLGIHKLTGKHVAIKTIEKSYMKDEFSRKKVFREVYILKKIRHANVIRLLEVFESSKHLLIVMEYAGGGDLLQYVKKHKRLGETEARTLFRQVVYGLAHIHSRSVLHRDIKLDNILLDGDSGVKICDFGVSKIIEKNMAIREQCGTPAYIAPEIISDQVNLRFNEGIGI